jgi:hypothetical protein
MPKVLIQVHPTGTRLAGGCELPGGQFEPREERAADLAGALDEEFD